MAYGRNIPIRTEQDLIELELGFTLEHAWLQYLKTRAVETHNIDLVDGEGNITDLLLCKMSKIGREPFKLTLEGEIVPPDKPSDKPPDKPPDKPLDNPPNKPQPKQRWWRRKKQCREKKK